MSACPFNRIPFRTPPLLFAAVVAGWLGRAAADEVVVPRHRLLDMQFRQLMLDDRVIERVEGCRKVYPQVLKDDRVLLRPTEPHERAQRHCFLYGSVLQDPAEGRFRMWYQVVFGTEKRDSPFPYSYFMAYAESADGLTWRKPRLGQVDYFGDEGQNNLVFQRGSMPHVFIDDPKPDRTRPTAASSAPQDKGVEPGPDSTAGRQVDGYRFYFPHPHRVAFSSDGRSIDRVRTIVRNNDIPNAKQMRMANGKFISDGLNVAYDPVDGLWRGVFKTWQPLSGSINPTVWRRSQALATSKDGLDWQFNGRILSADLADDRYVQQQRPRQHPDRPAWAELYLFPFFRYQGLLIGLPCLFYQMDGLRDGEDAEVFLAWSRDGLNWHRPRQRKPLIPNGPDGGADDGFLVCAVSPPIRRDDQLWLYYTANPHPHRYPFRSPGEPTFRLARLRADGWAGYRAGPAGGTLRTHPFIADGPSLRVNADCTHGEVRVEVYEVIDAPRGQPLKTRPLTGFSRQECQPLTGDSVNAPILWKSVRWDQLQGKPVVLTFYLQNATLYSFHCGPIH